MEEGPNIYRVAAGTVRQFGAAAYPYLCEQAEIAKLQGDRESAITWWDIALAVIELGSAVAPVAAKSRDRGEQEPPRRAPVPFHSTPSLR